MVVEVHEPGPELEPLLPALVGADHHVLQQSHGTRETGHVATRAHLQQHRAVAVAPRDARVVAAGARAHRGLGTPPTLRGGTLPTLRG